MKNLTSTLIVFSLCVTPAFAQTPNKQDQINAAIQAAPDEQQADASVLGYDVEGKLVMLKEGTNELICLADDPEKDGFSVACYHKDLEPFMARGRELYATGKNHGEVFQIREKEAKEGKLKMPDHPATLHVLSGPDGKYDPATGKVTGANLRYVVYIPFATAESTGLPIRPIVPGGPWIMDPGTHRAHIMISPPAKKEEDK